MLLAPVVGIAQSQSDSRASPGQTGSDGIGPIIVVEVVPDGPAALGGVRVGDLITKVESEKVSDLLQVVNVVLKQKPGDTLALTVFRRTAEKEIDLTVTLGQNPGNASKAWLGIVAREFLRLQLQEPKGNPASGPGRNASTL